MIKALNINFDYKQCRDRWLNYITKTQRKLSFSTQEISRLLELQLIHGNRWAVISKYFPQKGSAQIRNFFHGTIRKNIQKYNFSKPLDEKIQCYMEKILENKEVRAMLLYRPEIVKEKPIWKLSEEALDFVRKVQIEGKVKVKKEKNRKKDDMCTNEEIDNCYEYMRKDEKIPQVFLFGKNGENLVLKGFEMYYYENCDED